VKLREIERLRACAVLMVVLHHWAFIHPALPNALLYSRSGVDLFFVISGYVVTLSLKRLLPTFENVSFVEALDGAKGALRTFYTRRLCRIVPAALVAAALHGILTYVYPSQFGTPTQWTAEMIAVLTTTYNYVMPATGQTGLGVYWSLSVEEHFYLLLPLLFLAFRTTNRRFCMALMMIAVVAFVVRPMAHPLDGTVFGDWYILMSSHTRFDSLFAGVALALVAAGKPNPPIFPRRLVAWIVVPACLALITTLPAVAPWPVMNLVGFIALWALSGVLVAYAGFDRGYVLDLPGLRWFLEYIGARSYAIYLLHFDMMRLDASVAPHWRAYARLTSRPAGMGILIHTAVLFGATLVACELLYRLVERPAIAVGRHLTRRPEPALSEA
jgi:peptidoglycan/LPS O-acetylase OafA/YrhL